MSQPTDEDPPMVTIRMRVDGAYGALEALVAHPPASVPGRGSVLMVPGYTGSKEDFVAVLEPIARAGYTVVSIDQRGQHESPHAEDPAHYGMAALAEDLLAVAATLAAPVHLVGHSFGGLVSRAAVIAAPDAWRSLVMMGSGPSALPAPRADTVHALLGALPVMDMPTIWGVRQQLDAEAGVPAPTPEHAELLVTRWHNTDPVGLARMGEALVGEPDLVEDLRATGVPAIVIFGPGDDTWSPATQQEMAERLGVASVRVEGAGHSPAAERPAETAAALLAWWDEVG